MFESHQVTLTCPKCSHKFQEALGRLQNNPTLICRQCQAAININADDLHRDVDGAQREMDNLIDTIKKSLR